MEQTIKNNVNYIYSKINNIPEIGIILGSGLGALGDKIQNPIYIEYGELEGFAESTAPGHAGRFIIGYLGGKYVICMQGRIHIYEGYDIEKIILPIRTMRALGINTLIVTNAAGGINKTFVPGDIVLIKDHINFTGCNPLIGENNKDIGPRFPDMTFAYNEELATLAKECARKKNIHLQEGVYLACSGPSYETPAEINAFRVLGADMVGMSTVPEVIIANHCGLNVLAFSLISNMASGILKKKLTEEEVLKIGNDKAKVMEDLITNIIKKI